MTNRITLLLFIGLAWAQDAYPYFSDMGKQLGFEQKKIVVSDFKESRQIIKGGGSEFNWLTLISKYEPTYKIAPITTEFEYVTLFSITRNGKEISEIDFLNFVGLNSQADSIIADFRRQLDTFLNDKSLVFDERSYTARKGMCFGTGAVLGFLSITFLNDDGYEAAAFIPGGLSIALISGGLMTKKSKYMKEAKNPYPILKSFLTNEQVKSIAEAYNRKLYNDISNND